MKKIIKSLALGLSLILLASCQTAEAPAEESSTEPVSSQEESSQVASSQERSRPAESEQSSSESEELEENDQSSSESEESEESSEQVASEEKANQVFQLIFDSTDLEGNQWDEEIFQGSRVTMLNVWATWCGPCREEIPELVQLTQDYAPEDLQVIGVIGDVSVDNDENRSQADEILSQSGADYVNLLSSESLEMTLLNGLSAYPTTFFFNEAGELLIQPIVGARNAEQFAQMVDFLLEMDEE